jgi:hypothetical protein
MNGFKGKAYIAHVVFILIMTYAMSSFSVLGLAVGVLSFLPMAYLDSRICAVYALIAFALTAGLGVYHISTMVRTKKRWTDKLHK